MVSELLTSTLRVAQFVTPRTNAHYALPENLTDSKEDVEALRRGIVRALRTELYESIAEHFLEVTEKTPSIYPLIIIAAEFLNIHFPGGDDSQYHSNAYPVIQVQTFLGTNTAFRLLKMYRVFGEVCGSKEEAIEEVGRQHPGHLPLFCDDKNKEHPYHCQFPDGTIIGFIKKVDAVYFATNARIYKDGDNQ